MKRTIKKKIENAILNEEDGRIKPIWFNEEIRANKKNSTGNYEVQRKM